QYTMAWLRWIALLKSKKEKSNNLQPSLWIYACPISQGSSLLQKFVSDKAYKIRQSYSFPMLRLKNWRAFPRDFLYRDTARSRRALLNSNSAFLNCCCGGF